MGSTLFSKREKRRHNTVPGRNRRNRPKSFASAEKAKEWAQAQGIKEFTIRQLNSSNPENAKFVVVIK